MAAGRKKTGSSKKAAPQQSEQPEKVVKLRLKSVDR